MGEYFFWLISLWSPFGLEFWFLELNQINPTRRLKGTLWYMPAKSLAAAEVVWWNFNFLPVIQPFPPGKELWRVCVGGEEEVSWRGRGSLFPTPTLSGRDETEPEKMPLRQLTVTWGTWRLCLWLRSDDEEVGGEVVSACRRTAVGWMYGRMVVIDGSICASYKE